MTKDNVFEIEEILEHILMFANGKTLQNAEVVNTKWKYAVEHLSKSCGIWKLCCKNEISEDNLFDLLSKLYPRHWLGKNTQDTIWKTVYKHWSQWRLIPKWNYVILKVPIKFTRICSIFCVKSSGDWLFVGTSSCITFYNTKTSFSTQISTRGDVVSIQPYVTITNEKIKDTYLPCLIPDYLMKCFQHDYILLHVINTPPLINLNLNLHSGLVSESSITKAFIHCNLNVQIIPGSFATNGTLVSCLLRDTLKETNKGRAVVIFPPDSIGYEINTARNITLINFYKTMLSFSLTRPDRTLLLTTFRKFEEPYVPELDFCSKTSLRDVTLHYNWHCKVNILATYAHLEIHVYDRSVTYYPLQEIGNNVTAVVFYQNILFLATDLGNLYLYDVPELECLLTLDLTQSMWVVDICKESIKGIEIMESTSPPRIVCHSALSIFIIDFQTS